MRKKIDFQKQGENGNIQGAEVRRTWNGQLTDVRDNDEGTRDVYPISWLHGVHTFRS
jgi:hypothetical protein